MMRRYYTMLVEQNQKDTVGKMKQFATYFTHGVRHGSHLRAAIYPAQDAAAILDLVDEFFQSGQGRVAEPGRVAESGRPEPALAQ
jgi:tRNA-dihydrouridine synthase